MDILVRGLLSVAGQYQVAKDAPNFCSEWVSVSVFTLIVPLKVPPPKFDKGFDIGEYFGKGTFECCGAMPISHGCSKLLLWMGSNDCIHFDFPHRSYQLIDLTRDFS